MATTQLSGLISGFDWKSFVDSTIDYMSVPITRMESEQSANRLKSSALGTLDGKMTVLRSAVAALGDSSAFLARTTKLAASTAGWSASADTGAALGGYKIAVTQLATAARLNGTADIAGGLSATDDVSGVTLATAQLGTAITAGEFTINGQRITVDLADSLEDVFAAISTATGGEVTASYAAATDRVTLTSSGGPITLGAANDTSNFLSALRLANNGTATVSSSSALGALQLTAPIDSAGLRDAITAVDGSGAGSFQINGVNIDYNVTTDSLKTVLARINASTAGVTASYDAAADRVLLTNKTTGDTGVFVSEPAGGLLGALGLAGGTLERGKNALYSVNDGPELASAGNTLSADTHGIEGLRVTVGATGTDTVTIAGDTAAMKTKINTFISTFNDVQRFIEDQTKITSANGKVTTSNLSAEREVGAWGQTLRRNAFAEISGLSGTLSRLDSLGIDFTSGTSELAIKSSSTLDAALADQADQVAEFFGAATTGFAARMKTSLELISGGEFADGYIDDRVTKLAAANTDLDKQIENFERQLEQQRELLTSSFIAMETAQQTYNSMQSQLTKAFFSDSSK